MMTRFMPGLLLLLLAASVLPAQSDAGKAPAKGLEFFEAKVRPILVQHCYRCHATESGTAKGGLRVDSRQALRSGGDRGPAVVPGDPQASWLLTAVTHLDPDLKMPPNKDRLPQSAIADLRAWIAMGAPDPREEKAARAPGGKAYVRVDGSFWAYQPPRAAEPPAVRDRAWGRQALDHFILAELEKNKLAPSADASPGVLLRRLHFDLVGLPPTPAALTRFRARMEADGLDAALAAEVDELLAAPAFGEKWGRHWLDVARFGESSGGEANISFPYAWRYRDYVIDAINADIPFDRFVTEQVAGDLLPYRDDAERARLLIATGFLAVGPKNLDEGNAKQFQADLVDEQINAVTRAVLASSIACARCHDHKTDPFSMQDYYALAGVFTSTRTYFGTAVSPANRVGGDPLPLPRVKGLKAYHESIPPARVAKLKEQLASLRKEQVERQAKAWQAIKDGQDPEPFFNIRDALRIFWTSGAIEGQLEKVDESGQALPLAMGVLDKERVVDARLFERGDVSQPRSAVPRRFPEVFAKAGDVALPAKQSGRLELARWLTSPEHPLTSRVIVNRVWSYLFGAGLVRTVDNFGSTGEAPSHPELLDHLALRFAGEGWSIKKLVREFVMSRTYRQASTFHEQAFLRDPDNRLLWRAAKRRLPAEAIRDAMLAAAGTLDAARPEGSLVGRVIGDRPISLIGLDKKIPPDLDDSNHRSLYLPVLRDRLPDALDLFDFAEPSLVTGQRETTNVPVQALYLMNSPFVQKQAAALAARLDKETQSDSERIERAFLLCFSRPPGPAEVERCLRFLDNTGPAAAERRTLASFCQALLATAEFRNLD
jgi:hypothetical protein